MKYVDLSAQLLGYYYDEHELCLNSEAIGSQPQGLHHLPLCVYRPLMHFAVVSTISSTLQQFAMFSGPSS